MVATEIKLLPGGIEMFQSLSGFLMVATRSVEELRVICRVVSIPIGFSNGCNGGGRTVHQATGDWFQSLSGFLMVATVLVRDLCLFPFCGFNPYRVF